MDASISAVVGQIESCGIVAVIRLTDAARLRPVVDAVADGGVRALEITMTVPGAIALIERIAPTLPPGFVVGAGTILNPVDAARAADAGARFIVSPIFRRELVEAAHRAGAAAIPGCFSPTEIQAAWEAGADVVKVFPATALGPTYFKDIRGPLPHLKLMPTGGVSLQNAGDWIKAGAVAIGVGTALIDGHAVASGDYGAITQRAAAFVRAVAQARNGVPA